MCEAAEWRRLSILCVICFLLCVLFDVHCHSHGAHAHEHAPAAAPRKMQPQFYDPVVVSKMAEHPLARRKRRNAEDAHRSVHEMQAHDHADHEGHDDHEEHEHKNSNKKAAKYLKLIMRKYGVNGTLTFEGFEHLLQALHLGRLQLSHSLESHLANGSKLDTFRNNHENHNHTRQAGAVPAPEHDHDDHAGHEHEHEHENENEHEHDHGHEGHDHQRVRRSLTKYKKRRKRSAVTLAEYSANETCLTAETMFMWYRPQTKSEEIGADEFRDLCPSLIYQLDANICVDDDPGTNNGKRFAKNSKADLDWRSNRNHAIKVWGCSLAAVVVISLVGLAVVAIIPLMHHSFYNTLIQFLIAMAVGCLAGDALLHLIPHAFFSHSELEGDGDGHGHDHSSSNHAKNIYMALAALGGIYFFFVAERALLLCQKRRYKRRRKRRAAHARLSAQNVVSNDVGNKVCQLLPAPAYSQLSDLAQIPLHDQNSMVQSNSHHVGLAVATAFADNCTKEEEDAANNANANYNGGLLSLGDSESHLSSELAPATATTAPSVQDDHPDMEQDHDDKPISGGHGHSHGAHGHSHDISSFRSLVWTVIMGDGLHNFCDGMAIGAAFSNDLRGGLSTAVAVFCHELPHELGDFAVLLNAGMSVKSALFYNMVSSVLCLIGMALGVFLGNQADAGQWIFMITAGMFLYIALVDMMPELVTDRISKGGARPCTLFLFQNLGIISGAGVMLLIALYEDKILGDH